MNKKLIKQLLLYSSPLCAYVLITYAAQPEPSINIIEYPQSGPQSAPESGYIAAYYALQKLGIEKAQKRPEFLLESKNLIKKRRLLQATQKQIVHDLTDFIGKKEVPAESPIPGISSHDLKEVIMSVIPDIAQEIAQDYIRLRFDEKTGELNDRDLELSGGQILGEFVTYLKSTDTRYEKLYKVNWSMLEPDILKDNYALLRKYTGFRDISKLMVNKKEVTEMLKKEFPREEGVEKVQEATGFWLRPEEIQAIINANTSDTDKVMILHDIGLLAEPTKDTTDRTQEIKQIFDRIKQKMARVEQGTQTFIIDKAYVRGRPEQLHIWVPIIINKQANQLRLALIDPENLVTKDNLYIKILLEHLT